MGDSLLTDFLRHWRSAESVRPEVLAVSGGTLAVCPAVEGAPRLLNELPDFELLLSDGGEPSSYCSGSAFP